MEYEKILRLALVPSIVFLLLSLVSVALTTHYWIIGDWIMTRWVQVPTDEFDVRLQRYKTDSTIVWYTDKDTDVTIASGCLNLTAAVVALIAWSTLRKSGMDSQYAAGKRRFWIIAVVAMTVSGAAAALASIVLHYTEKGEDQYGCTPETFTMGGTFYTNMYCTREMGACNFLPKFLKAAERGNATVACNEIVVVKWLQIILIINAVIVLGLFGVQARLRRRTRVTSTKEPPPIVI
ncbi:Nn.00g062840.m01.CDS01 [Neocucurbitaria sp. VM-36]